MALATKVRLTCPLCRDIDSTADKLSVVIDHECCSYATRCPFCDGVIMDDLPRSVADQLVRAGCRYSYLG